MGEELGANSPKFFYIHLYTYRVQQHRYERGGDFNQKRRKWRSYNVMGYISWDIFHGAFFIGHISLDIFMRYFS